MAILDGKNMVFSIDGDVIGGIDSYIEEPARNPEVDFEKLDGFFTQAGQTRFGRLTLNIYRKDNDSGQDKLDEMQYSRQTLPLTFGNGSYSKTVNVYVVSFNLTGSDTGTGTSPCVLRIASAPI